MSRDRCPQGIRRGEQSAYHGDEFSDTMFTLSIHFRAKKNLGVAVMNLLGLGIFREPLKLASSEGRQFS
jgi:hypothetical protein